MNSALAIELLSMAELDDESQVAVSQLAAAEAWVREEMDARLSTGPGRLPRPLSLLDWPDGPGAIVNLLRLNRVHTGRLREIIDDHGWPGRSLVGEDASDAAWMLAMHGDTDLGLQRRCVALLKAAVPTGETDPRHYAVLADRVSINSVGTQIFGSWCGLDEHSVVQFLAPVQRPEALDARRVELGLPPIRVDLEDDAGRLQIPYRQLRITPGYRWPPRRDRSGS